MSRMVSVASHGWPFSTARTPIWSNSEFIVYSICPLDSSDRKETVVSRQTDSTRICCFPRIISGSSGVSVGVEAKALGGCDIEVVAGSMVRTIWVAT